MKDQFIGMNIKQKVKIKMQQMNIDISSNHTFLELIVLIYLNRDNDVKRFKTRRYYLSKSRVILNGKNFFDQATDSDIKRNKEISKLTTG